MGLHREEAHHRLRLMNRVDDAFLGAVGPVIEPIVVERVGVHRPGEITVEKKIDVFVAREDMVDADAVFLIDLDFEFVDEIVIAQIREGADRMIIGFLRIPTRVPAPERAIKNPQAKTHDNENEKNNPYGEFGLLIHGIKLFGEMFGDGDAELDHRREAGLAFVGGQNLAIDEGVAAGADG